MYLWRITGPGLPELRITARSFDAALGEARGSDPRYDAGQVIEDAEEPDFVGGAPNYDKFDGCSPEQVLAWLNVD